MLRKTVDNTVDSLATASANAWARVVAGISAKKKRANKTRMVDPLGRGS